MARKRAYKKRVDYRKGGRVKYQEGSEVFDPVTGEPLGPGSFVPPSGSTAVGGGTTVQPQPNQAYTQADLNKAVADLNAGRTTAAALASQYGVPESYVTQNLQTINQTARDKVDAISATGNYTAQQTQDVQDAIQSGAITTQEAATKFGVQPAQITQERTRRGQVADTGTTDIVDPYAAAP